MPDNPPAKSLDDLLFAYAQAQLEHFHVPVARAAIDSYIQEAIDRERLAEREACAKLAAPKYDFLSQEINQERALICDAIRDRSTTPLPEGKKT